MQTLAFEAAWKRTISEQDREHIKTVFAQTKAEITKPIENVLIKVAKNHLGHLLVTVLIHNNLARPLTFQEREVNLQTKEQNITKAFTVDALEIPAYTSVPWTFIFTDIAKPIKLEDVLALTIV